MHRNENRSIQDVFMGIQSHKEPGEFSPHWKNRVMADIATREITARSASLEWMAPRLTLAATALSAVALIIGLWSLPGVMSTVQSSYATGFYDAALNYWVLL